MISREVHFQLLCGLSVEKFNLIFEVASPYTDVIIYPDCKGNGTRIIDKSTELLTYLTICRHSLHLGVTIFMLDLGKSTVYWTFVGRAVFLEIIFSQLNLKPSEDCLLKSDARYICKNRIGND